VQGALGWYMVQSGLVEDPRVSHFRLTAHLGVALAIFSAALWIALNLLRPRGEVGPSGAALALSGTIFVMALAGGMVAGLRAGSAYNTFPLMNGHLVPPEILMLEPWWKNFFYNMATVQFVHRAIGWLLIVWVPWFCWRALSGSLQPRQRRACQLLLAALALQVTLGIATLVLAVPVPLAAAHQAGAVLLLGVSLWVASELRSSRAIRWTPGPNAQGASNA
jgi:cytochrome c oxidase assembly protein subunit 15